MLEDRLRGVLFPVPHHRCVKAYVLHRRQRTKQRGLRYLGLSPVKWMGGLLRDFVIFVTFCAKSEWFDPEAGLTCVGAAGCWRTCRPGFCSD